MAALLELDRARVDVAGVPAIDGLSLRTTKTRVVVLGAPRALFEAVCGARAVARGSIAIDGSPPSIAVRGAEVAGAPLDPPLPPAWSPRAYARWSARLVGHDRRAAAAMADEAIARMRLESVGDATLGRAPLHVRRAVVIAAAIATAAKTLVLDDPLSGLAEPYARALARAIVAALKDRASIVFASRLALGSPLAQEAEEIIVLAGSTVSAQGAPIAIGSDARAVAVEVLGDRDAVARLLTERGARVDFDTTKSRLRIALGDLRSTDVFAAATEAGAVIVELLPIAGALS